MPRWASKFRLRLKTARLKPDVCELFETFLHNSFNGQLWNLEFFFRGFGTTRMRDKHQLLCLLKQVEYALNFPWYASLSRIEHRTYLDHYGTNDIWIGKSLYKWVCVQHLNHGPYHFTENCEFGAPIIEWITVSFTIIFRSLGDWTHKFR
jgi:hypothetical protein